MTDPRLTALSEVLLDDIHTPVEACLVEHGELNVIVAARDLLTTAERLRDAYGFEELIDLCGIDYSEFGIDEWSVEEAPNQGFSRAVEAHHAARFSFEEPPPPPRCEGPRFAVAYQLLSLSRNIRLRMKVYCPDDDAPRLPSVVEIWNSANWFEREAFDLFGILFDGHPDLRRILTDYGFVGHPLRKDFPLIGHVEMRYDPEQGRVVYEPVSIEPRVNVPKVVRHDNRYADLPASEEGDA